MPESGLIAAITEPAAKARAGKWRAPLRDKEREVGARSAGQRRLQFWMQRDQQRRFDFFLSDRDGVAAGADVLLSHADHVAFALPGAQAERQREPSFGVRRVPRLELCNLLIGPTVMTIALTFVFPHTRLRVGGDHVLIDGKTQDDAQHLEQMIGRLRRVRLCAENIFDVMAAQTFQRFVAMRGAEIFQNVAALLLCTWSKTKKVRRAVVAHAQGIESAGWRQ